LHNRRRLNAHWSNPLDAALQSCQSRETFGIPVGPDTSRIIAELLLAGVDKDKALSDALDGCRAFRLVDDFTAGLESEAGGRSALVALRAAVWKFNLQLNEEKTSVHHSRTVVRERWKLDFDAISLSNLDPERQERDARRLFELTFHFCQEANSQQPAIWT